MAIVKRAGHVYVLGFSNGIVKIGRTMQPEQRLHTHAKGLGVMADITATWVSPRHVEWVENEHILRCALGGVELAPADIEQVMRVANGLRFTVPYSVEEEARREAAAAQEAVRRLAEVFAQSAGQVRPDVSAAVLFRSWQVMSGHVGWLSDALNDQDDESLRDCCTEGLLEFAELLRLVGAAFRIETGESAASVDLALTSERRQEIAAAANAMGPA